MLFLPSVLNSEDITIPEVSGKEVSAVVKELQDMGFEVADKTVDISDDKVPEGKVVKTNPPSGAKRTEGTVVTIYVSTGDAKYEIEDYTGKNYLEVKGALEAHNILVYVEKKDVKDPDDYDDGEIIEQDIEPGSKLGARDSITLYIPNVAAKYPDFTDGSYTVEDVQKFCEKYNISLEIKHEENSSYDEGTILKQSRPEGYTITNGTVFMITVASAPEETEEAVDDDCNGLC